MNTRIALLGQPNSGKSTVYNALTGSRQHVGNWPGKTGSEECDESVLIKALRDAHGVLGGHVELSVSLLLKGACDERRCRTLCDLLLLHI